MQKPTTAKGTRDFGPLVVKKRASILNVIRRIFEQYAFQPIQTPALENMSTLTGKYGEEGDKLLFKVLNSGDIARSINVEDVVEGNNTALIRSLAEKGLRYDLTVPFARFVVQHRNDISFPFRRYQIQEVWRADKPQKGRYREFTQCDADVIGSDAMLNEADLVLIYREVFEGLGLADDAVLKINHRKLLEAIVDELELDFPVTVFTSTLDKLDKIGMDGVTKELQARGVSVEKCEKLFSLVKGLPFEPQSFQQLLTAFNHNTNAEVAVKQLQEIHALIDGKYEGLRIELDLSLARGLDYYTGCIFEAVIENSGIGSVSGGGRYDDLTGVFGWEGVSGVGISFGVDRLYDIMEARALFRLEDEKRSDVLFCHFDAKAMAYAYDCANSMRQAGIQCQVYPDSKKLKKQLDYANKLGKTHVIVIGDDEISSGELSLKDMRSGTSEQGDLKQLIATLTND